ncbi:MAG: GNAT family N-acetyltransferase [Chloroflexi bacterium]|nr:GNAT family N-acetyltransferase [Chloroflexota bacterium]MBU1747240.1 GNAT family N-acetyltransferase [Chloroflexota bacterium]
MNLSIQSATDREPAQLVALLNRGFGDYLVPIAFDVPMFYHMIRHDGVDLGASRVVQCDGEDAGVALIARRGWTSRLAGMALVPEARGQGVGRRLMDQLIAEARARGERAMVLEVIEGNAAAVRLYEACGFGRVRRLFSCVRSGADAPAPGDLIEIDLRELARLVTAYGLPDLPWQLSGETLAQMGPPGRAYQMGDAWVGISNLDAPHVGIRAVVVQPAARRQGQATRLLQAVMTRYPGKTWHVPALCPEEFAPLFEGLGFERQSLAQWQMALDITGARS